MPIIRASNGKHRCKPPWFLPYPEAGAVWGCEICGKQLIWIVTSVDSNHGHWRKKWFKIKRKKD